MAKMIFAKDLRHLVPIDDAAVTFVSKLKREEQIMVEARRVRNIRHHRLLFLLLNMVIENTERYPDTETLLDALKIACGHCKVYPALGGHDSCPHCGGDLPNKTTYVRPLSISFESADQDKFNAFFDRAIHIICTKILVGTNEDALRAEVEQAAYGRYGT